ncbi:hypothetical protein REPUB_Repub05bG0063500 [Reevesia pubescens]
MGDIRFISTSIVQAAKPKKEVKRIELVLWDLMFLAMDYALKGLLYYKPKLQQDEKLVKTLVHHFKTSISQTLDYFFPLAGHLATIELEDEACIVPSFLRSFFPFDEVKNYKGTSNPLLAVQVTELADGIFLSCTYNHVVVDGTSIVNFFNSWAKISRGSIELSNSNCLALQHWFPYGIEGPVGVPNSCLKQNPEFIPPPLKVRFFHLTKEKIANLKANANAEVGTYKISSLQAILSHIWRAVTRNRNLDLEEETNFFLAVGAKSRLN